MRTADFDYNLPLKLIAQEPVMPRDGCRLMVINKEKQTIQHKIFHELTSFLRAGDVLVFNNSKVIPARLELSYKGKKIEIFLIRQLNDTDWLVIGKPGKILSKDAVFTFETGLDGHIVEVFEDGQRVLRFSKGGVVLERFLEKHGKAPFPPYIKKPHASLEDYQTVYAKHKGSVAAPTAGLHFTKSLLYSLKNRGVQLEFVTLHVGLGTFLPIKTSNILEHKMHKEWYGIDAKTAKNLTKARKEGRRIIAVGTTSVRVLESACHQGLFQSGFGETAIYIYPGYQWQCTAGLITNFHLPKSTLLLLVSSFGGKELLAKAYQEAIRKNYRFYSFGDAMFIE